MEDKALSPDTPREFLNALGESLCRQEGVDQDLLDILKQHILKEAPAKDAVPQAMDAIRKLAADRATPSDKEMPDV